MTRRLSTGSLAAQAVLQRCRLALHTPYTPPAHPPHPPPTPPAHPRTPRAHFPQTPCTPPCTTHSHPTHSSCTPPAHSPAHPPHTPLHTPCILPAHALSFPIVISVHVMHQSPPCEMLAPLMAFVQPVMSCRLLSCNFALLVILALVWPCCAGSFPSLLV